MWEELGQLQFDFLRAQGLEPAHHLLDIGCGSLRAGVHFAGYLADGHYCGIDAKAPSLEAGRRELANAGLAGRTVHLAHDPTFGFDAFDRQFDFALAHSVFTHIDINAILTCLLRVEKVLKPGAALFATYFENPAGTRRLDVLEQPRGDGGSHRTTVEANPYHYGLDLFEWLCEPTSLAVDRVVDWSHPRSQKMLAFTRMERGR
jgi:SAM-dependent methyltransferase